MAGAGAVLALRQLSIHLRTRLQRREQVSGRGAAAGNLGLDNPGLVEGRESEASEGRVGSVSARAHTAARIETRSASTFALESASVAMRASSPRHAVAVRSCFWPAWEAPAHARPLQGSPPLLQWRAHWRPPRFVTSARSRASGCTNSTQVGTFSGCSMPVCPYFADRSTTYWGSSEMMPLYV